jgi:hypothetical protein
MASFERDGHQIAYEVHGVGTPIVLLHGVTVNFAGAMSRLLLNEAG